MKKFIMALKLVLVAIAARLRGGGPNTPGYWVCCLRFIRRLYAQGLDGYYHVGKAFLEVRMRILSDRLTLSDDPLNPILIVVVKDDLLRMRLLFSHYRRLGVSQFVILDNGSTDGTAAFCASQPDTRVYHVATPYEGNRKEGWVERVIRSIGVNRWYIVADSDELLDYPGSESHSVQALIQAQLALGNRRLYGYMLDMYADSTLYSVDCAPEDIPQKFCFFDVDTYVMDEALYGMRLPMGGPRQRITGCKIWAGKCPVFLFEEEMSILSAHFMQPIVQISDTSLCCVLRHYKYLRQDRSLYRYREAAASGFGYTSREYQAINEIADQNQATVMYYENSRKYRDSYSLAALPGLYCTFRRGQSGTHS